MRKPRWSFKSVKHAMTSSPVLILLDFTKSFCIDTDACATGIGAVLTQEGQLVAFYSKALIPTDNCPFMRKSFWLKKLQQCAGHYLVYQMAKHEHCKSPGLLTPLPVPQGPWQDIRMDVIEGLPRSAGYNSILVVLDRFTKYSHFIALKHPFVVVVVA